MRCGGARLTVAVLAFVLGGCLGRVVHLQRNAPGRAALSRPPPADLPVGAAVEPRDPGERLFAVIPEATVGPIFRNGELALLATGQVAFLYGDRLTSHYADDLMFGDDTRVAPNRAIGGAIGLDLVSTDTASRRLTLALRLADTLGGIEAGYGFAPGPRIHSIFLGAYLSGWSRFFHVRVFHAFDNDVGVEIGLTLDYAFTWVWSK
jgi:hypothetical protein